MSEERRRPTAFRLDDPHVAVEEIPLHEEEAAAPLLAGTEGDPADAVVAAPPPPRRGIGFASLLFGGLGALISLAVGIWITDFVAGLFARNDWLAWVALAAAALAAIGFVGLVGREIWALSRLARIAELRREAEEAAATDDRRAARKVAERLVSLYAARPDMARARRELDEHRRDIIDGRDLIRLAERDLMTPLDVQARAVIIQSARRVSVVTAASPRAVVDLLFVLYESLRLVRRVGALYGSRPTGLALLKLVRMTISHLAVTGGVAITDGIVQQLVGHGVAARLSARLGEGFVNGLMTARIGLAALDVARPLPWIGREPPGMGDILNVLGGTTAPKGRRRENRDD